MNKDSAFSLVLIVFILIISFKLFIDSDFYNLKCIVSSVDGNKYCVREREKVELVVDLFARTSKKMIALVDHLKKVHGDKSNVKQLVKKFNPKKIKEILPTSKYTAYSENKGEKVAFCPTTQRENNELIDDNTLMFVALHEMSHIATFSIGHTKEFWDNFKFLIIEAVQIGIYKPVNYANKPKTYCGMRITDNPYYEK